MIGSTIGIVPPRILLIVILNVLKHTQADLLFVGKAGCLPGLFTGLGKDGEENGRENSDDSDNDEQLDERKAIA